jgi:hypothetical protein
MQMQTQLGVLPIDVSSEVYHVCHIGADGVDAMACMGDLMMICAT